MKRASTVNFLILVTLSFKCLIILIGLADVDDVKFVINFDYPNCSEDYVHRIGRTGRSSRTGTAYTFFTPNNSKQAQDLIGVLTEANQVINPKLYELASSSRGSGGRGGGKRHSTLIYQY